MADRPILMSGPLVVATLAGRKTQTRRVVTRANSTIEMADPRCYSWDDLDIASARAYPDDSCGARIVAPRRSVPALGCHLGCRWRPGDRLVVREAWMPADHLVDAPEGRNPPQWIRYRADGLVLGRWRVDDPLAPDPCRARECPIPAVGWRPSIHMPLWASRLTLVVDAVRVERVQEISEDDARSEGIPSAGADHKIRSASEAFAALWNTINGERPGCSWADNPFVWCISYHMER